MKGNKPSVQQMRVLAYLLKSEELNRRLELTILLTQDNDYFDEIPRLEKAGLVFRHPASTGIRPIYIVDRILASLDYTDSLRETLGNPFDDLDQTSKELLSAIYRFNNYSSVRYPGARLLAVTLWDEKGEDRRNVRGFDAFDRNVRSRMKRLEKQGLLLREGGSPHRPGYKINSEFKSPEFSLGLEK